MGTYHIANCRWKKSLKSPDVPYEGEFAEIYFVEGVNPVAPPNKPYEGLADSWGWYPVQTVEYEEPR